MRGAAPPDPDTDHRQRPRSAYDAGVAKIGEQGQARCEEVGQEEAAVQEDASGEQGRR